MYFDILLVIKLQFYIVGVNPFVVFSGQHASAGFFVRYHRFRNLSEYPPFTGYCKWHDVIYS